MSMKQSRGRHIVVVVTLGSVALFVSAFTNVRGLPTIQDPAPLKSESASTTIRQKAAEGYKLSSEKYARARAYRKEGYWLYFLTAAYSLLVLWVLLRCRVAPLLRNWAESVSGRRWLQLLLFGPTLLLVFGILLLPTDAYGQWRMRRYGLSVESWGSWLWDWIAAQTATLVLGTVIIGLLYYVMRRSPRRWWLFLWLIAVPLLVLIVFVQPILIDPLFNTLEPLDATHPELVDSIEKLLGRAMLTIPREHIYLSKVGDKSTEVDASSEGFGPSKRIFVTDTIIVSEPGAAILHTLGHEIGHYMLSLDWIVFVICLPLSLSLLYFVDQAFVLTLARWGTPWSIRGPDDWASLPVLALVVSLIAIALTPAANTLSRYREHEADRYGLELIHGIVPDAGEAAAQAFQKDAEINLDDPEPPSFIKWWLFDHPPINERTIFCRTYDPWSNGRKPKYVK
jgi:STE24 endopeptidase